MQQRVDIFNAAVRHEALGAVSFRQELGKSSRDEFGKSSRQEAH